MASRRRNQDKIVVLTTCGSAREVRRIARKLVQTRLAACVNVVRSPVESIYRWKGKVESAKEVLLVIKTSAKKFPQVERTIRELHSYDVPEIIALPVVAGSRDYLAWLNDSLKADR